MKLFLSLLALFILPGSIHALITGLFWINHHPGIYFMLLGCIIGLIATRRLCRIPGLETFEHELTHAIVALFFFRRITKFVSTKYEGGYIVHSGGFGGEFADHLIGLAPYFLPTFTFLFALTRPLISHPYKLAMDFCIGFSFVFHLLTTITEIRGSWNSPVFRRAQSSELTQSDIAMRGYFFSALVIFSLSIALHAIILLLVVKNYHGLALWLQFVYHDGIKFYTNLAHILMSFTSKLIAYF